VTENNDHLGLVVSGRDEEIKNVDKNISSARDSLFSFLGNIFSSNLSSGLAWLLYLSGHQ